MSFHPTHTARGLAFAVNVAIICGNHQVQTAFAAGAFDDFRC